MKSYEKFNEHQLQYWQEELSRLKADPSFAVQKFKDMLITERQTSDLLGVTERTMRRYRKNDLLPYAKIGGRIFYLKNLLYQHFIQESFRGR